MGKKEDQEIKLTVLRKYRDVARLEPTRIPDSSTGHCCSGAKECSPREIATALGYSGEDLEAVPEGANLGLGCGNPQAIAALRPGETVVDLGSGGGFDCFLAARKVGPEGRVIGVDMTPEMVALARENAARFGFDNVSFRLGEIENLPLADASVDVIISNCVVNLSSDKRAVYREAFRVLKPGGRLAISDVLATAPMPEELRKDLELWASCVSGASLVDDLEGILSELGFQQIVIDLDEAGREFISQCAPERGVENYVVAARIEATRPMERGGEG